LKLLPAFLRLVRWPNLLFIAITQILFVYCIVHPVFVKAGLSPISQEYIFSADGFFNTVGRRGNIINDYFDLNIDQINKPEKVVVDKIISRHWVIVWHLLLSAIASSCFYIDFKTNVRFLGVTHIFSVLLLFCILFH
jgi:4-hydroxybenzoate polyprenyltransferase